MSAFELLSENDKLMLEDYIKTYGPIDGSFSTFDTWRGLEIVLSEWDKNKRTLLKLFNNNLILSRPYSYLAQEDAISLNINKHLTSDPQPRAFSRWFEEAIRQAANDIEIYDFHGNNLCDFGKRYYSKWYEFRDCLTSHTLAANKYLGNEIIVEFKNSGHRLKIFKGMKPMKILHTLIKEFNGSEEMFDEFRIWHSMKLNQKRMDGELCLSIHPMDYLTMSDNNNDWKSCMRWTGEYSNDHGDYRSGTVQCLNSPYIIVAYLHNKNHPFTPTDNFSWNSKQWRELFIVQEGIINEIKGYPFQDENLTQTVLMWIKELASKNLGWEYADEEVDVSKDITNDIYLTFDSGDSMYKDIGVLNKHSGRINIEKLRSNKYEHNLYHNNNGTETTFVTIHYGGEATCMCCGKDLGFEKGMPVFCSRCDNIRICPCCGEPITNEDYYFIEELEDPLCYDCYSDKAIVDSFDESVCHLYENMDQIWLLLGYDEDGAPIFYSSTAYTYDPDNNWGYQEVFNAPPLKADHRLFVTFDMVNPGEEKTFFNAFDIYPYNWDSLYNSELKIHYNIMYSYSNIEMRELLLRSA